MNPIVMITIHGVVQMTMAPMNALTLPIRSNARRPTRMKTNASRPMNSEACTRLSRGKTEEKSRPVPYSEVTPVDRPPRNATTMSSTAYQMGEILIRATM